MEMEMVVQKNFPGVNTVKHFLRSCVLNGGTAGGIRIITMKTPELMLTLGSYFKEPRMTMSGNISRGPPNLNWSIMHVVMRLHFTSLARRGCFRPLATFSLATPKPTRGQTTSGRLREVREKGQADESRFWLGSVPILSCINTYLGFSCFACEFCHSAGGQVLYCCL